MRLLTYRFKAILRTKGFFLRCVIFPIIIATLCYTSFERARYQTVTEGEKISIGIVEEDGLSKDVFDEERFTIYNITETVARNYLEDGVISAYVRMKDIPELITIKYEDDQKITKAYLDAYLESAPLARLKEQHVIAKEVESGRSGWISNFAILFMAVTCTCLSGILLLFLIGKNHREIIIRSSLAARSGIYLIWQELVVILILLLIIFLVLYGYICFILTA